MEKQNCIVNGGIKLPIGYRFYPTDEELVVHYLKRKVFGLPLPASIIPELDVFQIHPLGLPGDVNEKNRYFFSNIGNVNANANAKEAKCKVAAGSGYWKYVGKNRPILSSGTNQVVGIRRSLIFFEGQRAHDTQTQWVMHEYLLVSISNNPSSLTHLVSNLVIIGGWSVYRIFQRKKKPRKISGAVSNNNIISTSNKNIQAIDFSTFQADQSDLLGPPEPDSSCSSEITVDELSSSVLDQEETSGCIIKHMNYRN